MTLMKSILLGSAAGIVAVAGAQAADLPTHKAAPVEYVKICNVGGITGWVMPGSDTCVKLSGYITAQFTGGNLQDQYNWAGGISSTIAAATDPFATTHADQRILVQGNEQAAPIFYAIPGYYLDGGILVVAGTPGAVYHAAGSAVTGASSTATSVINGVTSTITTPGGQLILPNTKTATFNRPATGWTVRANFGFDFASNTAYGPLIGHFDINSENGNGFDNTGNSTYLNTGYLTWAGITAGKAQSFFSFTGGGDNWANFASPDQKGFNEPDLMAYTASFGGGFTATIAAQSPGTNGGSGGGTQMGGGNIGVNSYTPGSITYGGQRWPDIVGALHVKQGWGEAQVSGVVHDVNVKDYNYYGTSPLSSCPPYAITGIFVLCNGSETKVGWGIDAGIKYNLPSWGPGDNILFTGAYTQNAVWYSGLPDMMWGENGQVNGNGQPMYMSDAFYNPLTNQWAQPRAWSISGLLEHHFTPQFYVDLEGSVGQLLWNNQGGGSCYYAGLGGCAYNFGAGAISKQATTWLVGADIGWNPVTNLNFDLELMYQGTNQERPNGFIGTVLSSGAFVPYDWKGSSDGFAGRFRITRYF